jgi:hypothetical protein
LKEFGALCFEAVGTCPRCEQEFIIDNNMPRMLDGGIKKPNTSVKQGTHEDPSHANGGLYGLNDLTTQNNDGLF